MRSTLHNFCQLGLAPARSSLVFFFALPCSSTDEEKKKGQRAHQLTEVSNTCLSLHIFCQLRLAPVPGSDLKKKEKCGRPSAISVNSAWHLPEVLWFFFRLALRKHRKKKKKKKKKTEVSNPYLSLSPQSL